MRSKLGGGQKLCCRVPVPGTANLQGVAGQAWVGKGKVIEIATGEIVVGPCILLMTGCGPRLTLPKSCSPSSGRSAATAEGL